MNSLEIVFWLLAAFVVYTYIGYPMLLLVLGRASRPPDHSAGPFTGSVALILAAHNEEGCSNAAFRS